MYIEFVCSIIILLLVSVFAEEGVVYNHPLTDMPAESPDIVTGHYFPNFQIGQYKFPTGEDIVAVCHFVNEGTEAFNISAIMGSLNSPFKFQHHYQNYSFKPFDQVIQPGEEISLDYTFRFHKDLDPNDYQLAITVFYYSQDATYSSTFVNETVDLYYSNEDLDYETVSMLIWSLLSVIFIIIFTIVGCFPRSSLAAYFVTVTSKIFGKEGVDYVKDSIEMNKEAKKKYH